jgi:hypothetical protein
MSDTETRNEQYGSTDLDANADIAYLEANYYTKSEVDGAIANLSSGGTVYEQEAKPDSGKDGDLWLSTPAAKAAAISALIADADTKELDAHVAQLVRSLMAGGKAVPEDLPWTPCVKVAGSGLIEARVLNGMIQLRGELTYTTTSLGTFSTVQRLPANFPKPPQDQVVVGFGIEQGVTYRRVFIRFNADGAIGVVGDGKITGVTFTGAMAYAY